MQKQFYELPLTSVTSFTNAYILAFRYGGDVCIEPEHFGERDAHSGEYLVAQPTFRIWVPDSSVAVFDALIKAGGFDIKKIAGKKAKKK